MNDDPDNYESYEEFRQKALFDEECNDATLQASVIEFTPTSEMPAVMYYGVSYVGYHPHISGYKKIFGIRMDKLSGYFLKNVILVKFSTSFSMFFLFW